MKIELELNKVQQQQLRDNIDLGSIYLAVQEAYKKAKGEFDKGDLLVEDRRGTLTYGIAIKRSKYNGDFWDCAHETSLRLPRKATTEEEQFIRPLLEGKK